MDSFLHSKDFFWVEAKNVSLFLMLRAFFEINRRMLDFRREIGIPLPVAIVSNLAKSIWRMLLTWSNSSYHYD